MPASAPTSTSWPPSETWPATPANHSVASPELIGLAPASGCPCPRRLRVSVGAATCARHATLMAMTHDVSPQRVSASRRVRASAADVFCLVADPAGHVHIDGSGMLDAAPDARPLTAVGQTFDMQMDRTPLNDNAGALRSGPCATGPKCRLTRSLLAPLVGWLSNPDGPSAHRACPAAAEVSAPKRALEANVANASRSVTGRAADRNRRADRTSFEPDPTR